MNMEKGGVRFDGNAKY